MTVNFKHKIPPAKASGIYYFTEVVYFFLYCLVVITGSGQLLFAFAAFTGPDFNTVLKYLPVVFKFKTVRL